MTLVVACGALGLAALLYVFWVEPEPTERKSPAEAEREFLGERKEMVYEGLRDLQMEYRMGKLSDEDYQQVKLSYQQQLAEILDEASRLETSPSPVEMDAPVAGRCLRCGHDNPADNSFCGACGEQLQPKGVPA